jgi:hypothetical protein
MLLYVINYTLIITDPPGTGFIDSIQDIENIAARIEKRQQRFSEAEAKAEDIRKEISALLFLRK